MTRLRARVDASARGSNVPAGIERGNDAASAGFRGRVQMRRRLRELRQLREAQLVELGALVLEAQRHGRDSSALIEKKAREASATDSEARALAEALGADASLDTFVASGVAGACPTCGALASTTSRFCSSCGTPLDGRPGAEPQLDSAAAAQASSTAEAPPIAEVRETEAPLTHVPDADAPVGDSPTTELQTANGHGAHADSTEQHARSDA